MAVTEDRDLHVEHLVIPTSMPVVATRMHCGREVVRLIFPTGGGQVITGHVPRDDAQHITSWLRAWIGKAT